MHIFLTAPRVCRPESKMIFGKVFLAAIRRISRNTGNPNQVEDAMKHNESNKHSGTQLVCHWPSENTKNERDWNELGGKVNKKAMQ